MSRNSVRYTEGYKKWDILSRDQRRLIETATGKTDPVRVNPVIFLSRICAAFGTVVKTNVLLVLLASLLAFFAMPNPRKVIGRSLSWLFIAASESSGPVVSRRLLLVAVVSTAALALGACLAADSAADEAAVTLKEAADRNLINIIQSRDFRDGSLREWLPRTSCPRYAIMQP
ncbi:MAG: hypothetical protein OHK006_17800 [Thermodesulfovibrionales bacterium]